MKSDIYENKIMQIVMPILLIIATWWCGYWMGKDKIEYIPAIVDYSKKKDSMEVEYYKLLIRMKEYECKRKEDTSVLGKIRIPRSYSH